ncbi:MAG: hypothetical protein ACLUKQ_09260 [Peptococcaceae bacterium]
MEGYWTGSADWRAGR